MTRKDIDIYTKDNAMKWEKDSKDLDKPRKWVLNRIQSLPEQKYKRLLDIGSGTGRWTCLFAESIEHVIGIDSSPEMIKIARTKNYRENIEYILGDIFDSSLLKGKKFDIVTSLGVLPYIPNRKMLNETYRSVFNHLNMGGHFLFYAAHPMVIYTNFSKTAKTKFKKNARYEENFPYSVTINMGKNETRKGRGYQHTMQEYIGDLIDCGFEIIKMEEISAKRDRIPFALVIDGVKR